MSFCCPLALANISDLLCMDDLPQPGPKMEPELLGKSLSEISLRERRRMLDL
jgi:hypothetical protein